MRTSLVAIACGLAGTVSADPSTTMAKRSAIAALIPGMAARDARARALSLGCDGAYDDAGQLLCLEGDEPMLGGWVLWFTGGDLERVAYNLQFDLDRLDDSEQRAARRVVERLASQLEAAANASGGRKRRTEIRSSFARGRCLEWSPSPRRASRLQLAIWQENGQQSELDLAFEIVAPKATFETSAPCEHLAPRRSASRSRAHAP